ncbi:MAG: DNA translocase FtsK, partial [Actinomycetota bacterium]|nr:DNA translocase FtsK [Actinomycetota bacterium]
MATRTSSAPKRTPSAKSGTSSGRAGATASRAGRSGSTGQTARTRQMAAVEPRQPWLLRVLGGAWLAVGHLVGGGVRRIGHDVSDLPPEERRDGAALFNLALAVFIATFAWWGFRGWFPDAVYAVVNGTFGWMSLVLPLMLFICAVRLFRRPADGRGNNRVGIGFLIMTFAGCGLAHIIGGQPTVAQGFDGLRQAGGMLGFLASSPLAAIHAAVPVALYGVLAFVSVLIVTATPFTAVPRRLRAAYEHLMGIDLQEHDADSHDRSYLYENIAPAAPKKKRRRLFGKEQGADPRLEGYVGDEAFEHAVIDDD